MRLWLTAGQWCNKQGGQGAECPPQTFYREIFADLPGKKRQEKRERGKIEKKRKIVKKKVENWKWEEGKLQNEKRTSFFFFFFCFSLFKTKRLKFVLGLPKWKFSAGEKAFHARKKIRKNDFAPLEKFSCYAPAAGVLNLFKKAKDIQR